LRHGAYSRRATTPLASRKGRRRLSQYAVLAIRENMVWFSGKHPAFPTASAFLEPIFPPEKTADA
ncbi:MAG: hypothetical protein K0M78_02195, partial [Brevundimonas sp.]|nr:hypothetical protein [Brevundimonas sp.]